jgi:uncharacterized protein DUF6763
MRDELEPVTGNWYTHRDKGHTFQVVNVDEDRDLIEIQYFDGDLEELDSDEWYDMDLEVAEPPEDERGPLDDDETTADGRDDNEPSERVVADRDYRDELEGNRIKSNDKWEEEEDEEFDEDEDDDEDEDEDEDEDDWGGRGSSEESYDE